MRRMAESPSFGGNAPQSIARAAGCVNWLIHVSGDNPSCVPAHLSLCRPVPTGGEGALEREATLDLVGRPAADGACCPRAGPRRRHHPAATDRALLAHQRYAARTAAAAAAATECRSP